MIKTVPFPEARIAVRQFLKSSYLLPGHACCWNAQQYLFPPSQETNIPIEENEGISYVAVCKSIDQWNIDVDGTADTASVPVVFVEFCPFCGERLPENEKETEQGCTITTMAFETE